MSNTRTVEQQVDASLGGDKDAFGEIVKRYQALVCSITYSMTGDIALSEDLAQETFVTAWQRLRFLRDPSRLKAWLRDFGKPKEHKGNPPEIGPDVQ